MSRPATNNEGRRTRNPASYIPPALGAKKAAPRAPLTVSHMPLRTTFWGPACNMPGFPLCPLGILSCCRCPNQQRQHWCPAKPVMPTAVQTSHQGCSVVQAEEAPSCCRACGWSRGSRHGLCCVTELAGKGVLSFPITFPLWGPAGAHSVWAAGEGRRDSGPPLLMVSRACTPACRGSGGSTVGQPSIISGHKSCPAR